MRKIGLNALIGIVLGMQAPAFSEEEQAVTQRECVAEEMMPDHCCYVNHMGGGGPFCTPPCLPQRAYCRAPCAPPPCDPNIFFTAEFLYWNFRTDGLPYAESVTPIPGQLANVTVNRVKSDSSPGVRLELDYLMPCADFWNISLAWTYLHSHTSSSVHEPAGGFIHPIWLNLDGNPSVSEADARYRFTLNIADLDFGRPFNVGSCLQLHPFAGLRALFIKHDLDVLYSGGDLVAPIDSDNRINFWGVGLRAGLDMKWNLCYGFSLCAHQGIDILWSKATVKQTEHQPSGAIRNLTRDSIQTLTPIFELFLGLMWEGCMPFCGWDMSAHIGWEEQYLINAVQFNQYLNPTGFGDPNIIAHEIAGFGLGGLTLGVTFGF